MHAVGEAPAGAPSAEEALAAVRGRLHRASEVARSNAKRLWIAAKEVHARLLAERDPAAEGAEPSDGLDGEPARALVVGVCGMSCSGKSTVVAGLRAHASQLGSSLPVLCLDDFFHEWMFDACEASMEAHPESTFTMVAVGGPPPIHFAQELWEMVAESGRRPSGAAS